MAKVEKAKIVFDAIREHTGDKREVSGTIVCPICDSDALEYSVAYNGHIHARCNTKDCFFVMI